MPSFSKKSIPRYTLNHKFTVATLHRAIRDCETISIAAKQLKIKDVSTLSSHLGKFVLDGKILSFEQFKQLSVARAEKIWGLAYHKAMKAPNIDIDKYSVVHIHEVVLKSKTPREAANQLGVRDHSLRRYVSQFKCGNQPLNFDKFKSLEPKQLQRICKDKYEIQLVDQRKNLSPHIPFGYIDTPVPAVEEIVIHKDDSFLQEFEHLNSWSFFSTQLKHEEKACNDLNQEMDGQYL